MPAGATTPNEGGSSWQGFAGVLCVTFGHAEDPAAKVTAGQAWQSLYFESAGPEALLRLKDILAQAYVGLRLVLAGPPVDVFAAAAAAASCGLVDEEISLRIDTAAPSNVFCGHCHISTATTAKPGFEVECCGCFTALAITDHFSRRKAAYLGFSAHAEEAT